MLWSKYRWYCEERACPRLSFFASTAQVPRRARSTGRLLDHVVDAVMSSGLGVVDGRDLRGVGDWLFAPLASRLGVPVVAIDPSAAFRMTLRIWLPCTSVAVDHFHLVSLANQAMTEARQNLSRKVKGRRGRGIDKAWAHRMLLLRAAYRLSDAAVHRMAEVFAAVDPTGKLQSRVEAQGTAQGAAAHRLSG